MHDPSLVIDLATVLALAGVIAAVFRRFGQPVLLGYLAVGLIVGPYLPIPIFADVARIHELSELGVVLVMFAVGLEFSLRRMLALLPLAGVTGAVQIAMLGWAGYVLGLAFGMSPIGAVFLGASLAISSTMVVAKTFEDTPPPSSVRRMVLGVLVLQDVVAIAMLAALSGLATGGSPSGVQLASIVARLVLLLIVLIAVGLLIVPVFIRWVHRLRNAETLLMASMGVGSAFVLVAYAFEYSLALGAFLGGMLVAESGLAKRIEHLVQPVRDIFAAVFFVSVGMSVDPRLAAAQLVPALAIVAVILGGQFLSVSFAGLLSGVGLGTAVTAGLALGQIGEFAFIITGLGVRSGYVPKDLYAAVVMAAVLTSFTTPLAVAHAAKIASAVERRLPDRFRSLLGIYEAWLEQIRHMPTEDRRKRAVRRALVVLLVDATGVAVLVNSVALTLDDAAVWVAQAFGMEPSVAALVIIVATALASFPLLLGILRATGNLGTVLAEVSFPPPPENQVDMRRESRRLVVVAIQLLALVAVGAPLVALTQPFLPSPWSAIVFVAVVTPCAVYFWRRAETFHHHLRAGAEAVLAVLARDHDVSHEKTVADLLSGLGFATRMRVPARSFVVGKTLGELDLRVHTGAAILAIARPENGVFNPSGHDRLCAGDELAIAGSPEAAARLRAMLEAETDAWLRNQGASDDDFDDAEVDPSETP